MWGTEKISATTIIEKMMANAPVQVKYPSGTDSSGNTIYKIDEQATIAAQGKCEEIQNAFKDWIWNDPERRNRLERLYNDQFNTFAPVRYDGSHLALPNLAPNIKLRQTQKNAIWRGIQEGTALFDHTVGAGKTFAAVGTIMESRRMGLLNKPMLVVPNNLLGQWKDEFYAAYPTANVLVAEKSDFEKDNRQRLFGQIATGDWDAVIVAHSSFKFIGLNVDDLHDYLKNQIKDIQEAVTSLKSSGGQSLSIKELEKQSKRIEAQVKKVTEAGRKDNTITFDQLGVDALFVDEADEFKNLAITTSLSRVAGLGNLAGSEKAMDLYLKCRYLQEKNDGRGVYFLTGTPISNSIAELYTMQRYMQYDTLKEMNVLTFDAWASTFGEVVSGWELDATGVNYRLNSRFAKFTNVPELVNLYRSFADVVTQQDLAVQAINDGTGRLVPKVAGGRPQNVICPRSDAQANYMGVLEPFIDVNTGRPAVDGQGGMIKKWSDGSIIYRMENMPDDPSIDNALKVTNDARLAALDFRLKDRFADDFREGKVNEAVRRIFNIWQENEFRQGTQLVFCDLSTPKKKKKTSRNVGPSVSSINDDEESGQTVSMDELLGQSIDPDSFSVYDDMRTKLINLGIPANQVRFIHDADNEQKRNELRRDMNNGVARITFGSTFKMGAGTNYQKRLVALHHLDAPWRPRDLEQREGRIIRQGNIFFEQDKDNFEVQIYRYATEKTYDARMWQNIEVKARGIEQFRRGSLQDRVIDDVVGEAANAAEMKAAATGNELIFLQVKIEASKRKQETLFNSWRRSQHSLESRIESLPGRIERAEEQLVDIEQQNSFITAHSHDEGLITSDKSYYWRAGGKHIPPEKAIEQLEAYIIDHIKVAIAKAKLGQLREAEVIGQYRGLQLTVKGVSTHGNLETHFALLDETGREIRLGRASQRLIYTQSDTLSVTGLFTRLDNALQSAHTVLDGQKQYITELRTELDQARERACGEYPGKPYLDALRLDAINVMKELRLMQEDAAYNSAWLPQSDNLEPKPVVVPVEQLSEVPDTPQPTITVSAPLGLAKSDDIPTQLSIDDFIEGSEMNSTDSLAIELSSSDSDVDTAYKEALVLFERSMLGEVSDSEVYSGAMRAADAGSPNGMLLVGICHADGIAVSVDYDLAHYWYSVAGDAGSTEAAYRMGEIYEFGWEGVATDLPTAAEWYKKADGFILATDALRRIDRRLLMEIDVTQLASQPLAKLSASLDVPEMENIDSDEVLKLHGKLSELHVRECFLQANLQDWLAEQNHPRRDTDSIALPSGQVLDIQRSDNLVVLNSHLVSCISKAVASRKQSGTGELFVGDYRGMAIEVCSSEDALQFKLKGVNEHCPGSLRYEKGVREKFKLPEFITSIGDFIKSIDQNCQQIKQQLVEVRNNIYTVKLAIEQVQGNVSPVVQSSPVHQNTDSNSGDRLSRPSNR
ncbi:DEAD/DEAH box helicase family protein [Yersinia aldovae]|uniref:DEAD/DEAH box helicase family protein n=1 Tax=Yersinia aldovae TaxID=29483 RepID=UPI001C94BBC1|nr:DEAD/DEAH box helicase family protein [Yersinia aldovae]